MLTKSLMKRSSRTSNTSWDVCITIGAIESVTAQPRPQRVPKDGTLLSTSECRATTNHIGTSWTFLIWCSLPTETCCPSTTCQLATSTNTSWTLSNSKKATSVTCTSSKHWRSKLTRLTRMPKMKTRLLGQAKRARKRTAPKTRSCKA